MFLADDEISFLFRYDKEEKIIKLFSTKEFHYNTSSKIILDFKGTQIHNFDK